MAEESLVYDFEKLDVYQCALDLMKALFSINNEIPASLQYSVGNQLIRAGLSVSNNIAEGSGKLSAKEKRRYYGTAIDSCRECVSILNVLKNENLVDKKNTEASRVLCHRITSMMYKLIRSAKDFTQ